MIFNQTQLGIYRVKIIHQQVLSIQNQMRHLNKSENFASMLIEFSLLTLNILVY